MLKQVLRAMIVSALVLAVASPAWANSVNVILDDPIISTGSTGLYLIPPGASPTLLAWQGCTFPPVPPNEGAFGFTDCLAFANDTGGNLSTFEIMIPIPAALNGDMLNCSPTGPLTINNCGSIGALVGGTTITLVFSGDPGVPIDTNFYFGISGADVTSTNIPNPTVSVPTHDPSTLVLLAVGMAMLAMGGVRRYA